MNRVYFLKEKSEAFVILGDSKPLWGNKVAIVLKQFELIEEVSTPLTGFETTVKIKAFGSNWQLVISLQQNGVAKRKKPFYC